MQLDAAGVKRGGQYGVKNADSAFQPSRFETLAIGAAPPAIFSKESLRRTTQNYCADKNG
jgi:hypothetical protein